MIEIERAVERLRDNALTDEDIRVLLLHIEDLKFEAETANEIADRLVVELNALKQALDGMIAAYIAVKGEVED